MRNCVVCCGLVVCGLVAVSTSSAWAQSAERFKALREKMVADDIEREGMKNSRVLMSLRTTPRHEFVPTNQRKLAYFDMALPIGHGQTISSPFVVAYMTETIDPQPTDRVLEIGTGSGFQAAVLAPLVKDVYTIEIVEPLGEQATKRLKDLGYVNVHCRIGDGYLGWPEAAPFDKIIVTCSPEKAPQPLIDQLKEGGKMVVPLGERYSQVFHLLEKREGKLVQQRLIPTLFVPMTGASEDQRVVQPDPLNPKLKNPGFEEGLDPAGLAHGWHYQRQATVAAAGAPEGEVCLQLENIEPGRLAQALQGVPLEGAKLGAVQLGFQYRTEQIAAKKRDERPVVMLHFYDDQRRTLADFSIPLEDSLGWHPLSRTIAVPPKTREAILRVSLSGATGRLYLDDVHFNAKWREK